MEAVTKEDLAQLRSELIERIEGTRTEMIERIEGSRMEMIERIEQTETTLLKEFRKWAVPQSARMKVFEINVHSLAERVELLEERMTDLEQK